MALGHAPLHICTGPYTALCSFKRMKVYMHVCYSLPCVAQIQEEKLGIATQSDYNAC